MVTNAAQMLRKIVPRFHSLAACEWAPDFSASRLIEIIPFSQNNSVTRLQFKQALPSVATGLTMWRWLGCYDVWHHVNAC